MADVKRKISELESSSDLDGLYTIGVNSSGESVKVPLGEITETMRSEVSETATTLIDAIPVASGTGTNSVISVNSTEANTAAGGSAISLGVGNEASGNNTVAVGSHNSVSSDYSNAYAIGGYNDVNGNYAGAFGQSNEVSGSGSIAAGYGLQTTNNYEAALGAYNESTQSSDDDAARTALSVGVGSATTRKNALELKRSGDLYVAGGVYPNGGSEEVGAQIAYIKAVLHSDAELSELADAFAALGDGYATLYEVASTLRTFLQDEDATDETINKWKELEAFLSGITDSDTLSGLLQSMQSTLEGLVEDEASARKAADTTLQDNIDAEETARKAADTTLQDNIDAIPVASGTGSNSVISVNSASANTAAGASAIALGAGNAASGAHAAAVGYANSVSGDNSAAIGVSNTVSGTQSGALGYNNTVGEVSNGFALGSSHDVQGGSSVAVGYALQTTNNGELAAGLWNSSTTSTDSSERTLMSVGNGSDSDNRKNALELKHSGDLYVGGTVYVNSTLPLACAIIETLGANGNEIGDTLAALQPYTYYYIDADGAFTWASDSGGSWQYKFRYSSLGIYLTRFELLNEVSITSGYYAFYGQSQMAVCAGLQRADWSALTTAYNMFYGCSALTSVDLSSATFPALTTASQMFSGCSALTSVDLSAATFPALTSASYMFSDCSALEGVDLSAATFDACTTAYAMFYGCSALESVEWTATQTFPALTNAQSMFCGCSALTSVDLSAATFEALTTAYQMFRGCSALTSVDLSAATFPACTTTTYMFYGCSALESVEWTATQTFPALTNAQSMFCGCSALTSVDLSAATFEALTTAYQMFCGCSALEGVDLSAATFDACTTKVQMFYGCSALTSVDLSAATFSALTSASHMFYGCSKLVTVACPETGLDCSNVVYSGSGTGFAEAFYNCSALQSIYLANICAPLDLSASTVFLPECAAFIMNNAQDVTAGVDGSTATSYTISFNKALEVTDDVEAAIAAAVEKGWTVTYGETTYSE